ncbi:MAG: DUF1467 family protein [Defluviimonas denitrificans]|jgi:predicted secreted protein
MSVTGGLVLFAVIWFITFFIALQIRPGSQAEDGHVVPGTPPGAPANFQLKRKIIWTTMFAVVIWSIIAAVIVSGVFTLRDIDWFGRLDDMPQGQ